MFMYHIKKNWQWYLLPIVLGAIVFVGMEKAKQLESVKPVQKEVAKVEPQCTTQEVKMVLQDSTILNEMNLFVVDLNTNRFVSDSVTTEYHNKEKMYCVKRELISGAYQVYSLICEPLGKLKYNAGEYSRYLLKERDKNTTKPTK